MPRAKRLPRLIAEDESSVRAINGKAFAHGFKQRLVEGIERREFRLKLFERRKLPMQPLRCRPAPGYCSGLRRLEGPVMRTDSVAQLLQTQSDFSIHDQQVLQLRDGRRKHSGNQEWSISKQAVKICKQKICRYI